MTTATRILAIALALAATAATAGWVTDTSKTITYALTAQGTASWSIGNYAIGDQGWLTKAWSYNQDMSQTTNGDYSVVTPTTDGAVGGVIYHFQATNSQEVSVALAALVSFNNWGGRKTTLYYSDKAWSDLSSPLNGSKWPGWGDEWETNANWLRIDDAAAWGGDQLINLVGTQTSNDGDFFLRVDLTTADAPPNSINLLGANWTATAVPEPASLALALLGGAVLLRRRR
jgi:hypothetical protein